MMPLDQVRALLEGAGFPVAYRFFRDPPPPPYLCYLAAYTQNFAADGRVWYPVDHLQVELYTRRKDPQAESRVEDALSGFFWDKSEAFLDGEQLFQVIYEIEV